MSNKTESAENQCRVAIHRKSGASLVVSNNPNNQRAKPKLELNQRTANPISDGESTLKKKINNVRDRPATAPTIPRIQQRPTTITASPSDIIRSSRLTTLKQDSISNKRSIPVYIRNKPNSKYFVSEQLQISKKQFNQIKNELTDLQNKAIEYHKRYRNAALKFNKLNGKNDPPSIEDMQMINFIDQTEKPPKISSSTEVLSANISFSKMKRITSEKILSDLSKQVQDIQAHSLKLLREFSDRLILFDNPMKSVENSEGGDNNVIPEKLQNLYKEIESKIWNEEKEQETRIINFMTSLKQVMINEEGTPVLTNDSVIEEYVNYRKTSEHKINDLEKKLKILEMEKSQDELIKTNLTKAISHQKTKISELNIALTKNLTKCTDRTKEFDKVVLKLKQTELANKRMEIRFKHKALQVIAKDKSIEELKATVNLLQEKVSKYTNQIQQFKSYVTRTDKEHKNQIDRLKTEFTEEIKTCEALRKQINELNLGMADEFRAVRDENIKLKNNENRLSMEIDSLKRNLSGILQRNATKKSWTGFRSKHLNKCYTTLMVGMLAH